jgi:hypothetical protein
MLGLIQYAPFMPRYPGTRPTPPINKKKDAFVKHIRYVVGKGAVHG